LALKVNTGGNQAGACAANCGQNEHISLCFSLPVVVFFVVVVFSV